MRHVILFLALAAAPEHGAQDVRITRCLHARAHLVGCALLLARVFWPRGLPCARAVELRGLPGWGGDAQWR